VNCISVMNAAFVVLIENPCQCDEGCELVCCEQSMKPVKATAKASASKASVKAPEKSKK
jgi:hypothetical protein